TANRTRLFAALTAILEMYRDWGEATLMETLPRIVSAIPDKTLYRLVFYLDKVDVAWEYLDNGARNKAIAYVRTADKQAVFRFLPYALRVTALKDFAHERVADSSTETLERVLRLTGTDRYLDYALLRFENVTSFREAEVQFGTLILPHAESLGTVQ